MEQSFVVNLLNENINDMDINYMECLNFPCIIEILSTHKLLGHAYFLIKKNKLEDGIHNKWLDILKFYYLGTHEKNEIYLKEFKRILTQVEGVKGIKGIDLLQNLYPTYGQRPINDIDLLLDTYKSDIHEVTYQLNELGYKQTYLERSDEKKVKKDEIIYKLITHSSLPPFVKRIGNNRIKVDINIKMKGKLEKIKSIDSFENILNLVNEIYFNQTNIHSVMYFKDIELIKYVDLDYIFKRFSYEDFSEFFSKAVDKGMREELEFVLKCYLSVFENNNMKLFFEKNKLEFQVDTYSVTFPGENTYNWEQTFSTLIFDVNRRKKLILSEDGQFNKYEQTFKKFKR
ncbi:hypothetical protein ABID30_000740 [Enterococcus rotai]|uniref:Uncharacterized protein n=1 Tax=Enterococcus rotai TaxID=118060 RepID=A0A0U2XFI3_9ENTE|nr:nucleotidyltransferase family protein [Enterococcus rotai]ALS36061.1 hypothetical protein ATZ35_02460 [Enterococcus rotai]